jgi:hypothetical protein
VVAVSTHTRVGCASMVTANMLIWIREC